jgi:hypothetical protein
MLAGTRNRHLNGVWLWTPAVSPVKTDLSLAQGTASTRWDQVLARLERIEEMVSRLPE